MNLISTYKRKDRHLFMANLKHMLIIIIILSFQFYVNWKWKTQKPFCTPKSHLNAFGKLFGQKLFAFCSLRKFNEPISNPLTVLRSLALYQVLFYAELSLYGKWTTKRNNIRKYWVRICNKTRPMCVCVFKFSINGLRIEPTIRKFLCHKMVMGSWFLKFWFHITSNY